MTVLILLLVILILLCIPQAQRGRTLAQLIAFGVSIFLLCWLGSLIVGVVSGDISWLWEHHVIQTCGKWAWISWEWLFGGLMVLWFGAMVYWEVFRLNRAWREHPRIVLQRGLLLTLWAGSLLAASLSAALAVLFASIPQFGAGATAISATLSAGLWFAWYKVHQLRRSLALRIS